MSQVITAAMVSELRQRTGAGMMDCKKALVAAAGDMEVAEHEIAKAGNRKAEKTAARVAVEGTIVCANNESNTEMVLVEINCETDFVAKDGSFLDFCRAVAQLVLRSKEEQVALLKDKPLTTASNQTLEEARQALVGKIGENIQVRRAIYVNAEDGVVGSYIHSGRIGVLVRLKGGDNALAKDLAMHVAALQPQYLSPSDVPADRLAKETEIFMAQSENTGKPAAIVEKMMQGRLNKYLNEICLIGQPFVKNPDVTVAQLLKEKQATVVSYVRLAVGEGLEKKAESNFADEVAQMIGGK